MAAKKMILVDPLQWKRIGDDSRTVNSPFPDSLETNISSLNSSIKEIIDRDGVDNYNKANEYQQALQRYLHMIDKYKQRPLGQINIPDKQNDENDQLKKETPLEEIHPDASLISSIPPKHRDKAKLLISHIQKSPEISWDNKNQLKIGEKTVEGSNKIDLIHDLTRDRKVINPPKGWLELTDALKNTNVSREIIGNRNRWLFINQPESITHQSLSRSRPRQRTPRQRKSPRSLTWEERS